jgi:hypothetical protein
MDNYFFLKQITQCNNNYKKINLLLMNLKLSCDKLKINLYFLNWVTYQA